MTGARTFLFGPFQLIPERQLLMRDHVAVRLGGRAFDLLTALVERAGELISKAELIAQVWPTTTVEDGNLKVTMGSLRRALEDDVNAVQYVATIPGRGYRFVAPVKMQYLPDSAQSRPDSHWDAVGAVQVAVAALLRELRLSPGSIAPDGHIPSSLSELLHNVPPKLSPAHAVGTEKIRSLTRSVPNEGWQIDELPAAFSAFIAVLERRSCLANEVDA